jgi:TetR/AcrR family transcriptional regulator, cholesterol catabolism regulator
MEQEKKDTILVEATKAFERYGFKKTSIDDVAKAAGVAKGTVYLACESKEDLFYQVLHREVHQWMSRVGRLIDPRVPADELLGKLAAESFQELDRHPLVKELLLAKASSVIPAWSDIFDELRTLTSQNILEVLRLGIRQGVFRSEIDADAVANVLRDLPLSTYIFYNDGPDRAGNVERRRRAALDLVLNGLLKKSRKSAN